MNMITVVAMLSQRLEGVAVLEVAGVDGPALDRVSSLSACLDMTRSDMVVVGGMSKLMNLVE